MVDTTKLLLFAFATNCFFGCVRNWRRDERCASYWTTFLLSRLWNEFWLRRTNLYSEENRPSCHEFLRNWPETGTCIVRNHWWTSYSKSQIPETANTTTDLPQAEHSSPGKHRSLFFSISEFRKIKKWRWDPNWIPPLRGLCWDENSKDQKEEIWWKLKSGESVEKLDNQLTLVVRPKIEQLRCRNILRESPPPNTLIFQ